LLIGGKITSSNLLEIAGPSSFGGNALFNSNIRVLGDLEVDGTLTFLDNVDVWDDTHIYANLTVDSNVEIEGDLIIGGKITSSNLLEIQGPASFGDDVEIQGDLLIGGKITSCNLLEIQGPASFGDAVEIQGDLLIGGKITSCNLLEIQGPASFGDAVEIQGDLLIGGKITSCNILEIQGESRFGGDATFDNNMEVLGSISCSNSLIVEGTAYFDSNIGINSDLQVFGNSYFNNDVEINADTMFNSNIVVNGLSLFNDDIEINANLDVNGTTTLNDQLIINSNAIFNNVTDIVTASNLFIEGCNFDPYWRLLKGTYGPLRINTGTAYPVMSNLLWDSINTTLDGSVVTKSNLIVEGNLVVLGAVSLENVEVSVTTLVTPDYKVMSNLDVMGDATFLHLYTTYDAVFNSNIVVNGPAEFNDDFVINASLDVYGITTYFDDYIVNAHATFNSNITLNGNYVINGTSILNGDYEINGDTMLYGGMEVLGETTFPSASNIYIEGCNFAPFWAMLTGSYGPFPINTGTSYSTMSNLYYSTVETTLNGSVLTKSNMIVEGDLVVLGAVSLENVEVSITKLVSPDYKVMSNLEVMGDAIFNTLTTSYQATFNEDATINSNLTVNGNYLLNGSMDVLGESKFPSASNIYIEGCNFAFYWSILTNSYGPFPVNTGTSFASTSNEVYQKIGTTLDQSTLCKSNLVVEGQLVALGGVCLENLELSVTNLNMMNFMVASNLDIRGETYFYNQVTFSSCNNEWSLQTSSNSGDLIFQSANNTTITFTDDFQPEIFNFTGKHRCTYVLDEKSNKSDLIGKIVCSTGEYRNLDNLEKICIDEAIPIVELSNKPNDQRVFGVISGFEEPKSKQRTFRIGNIRFNKEKDIYDTKVIVNSVGEGAIKICNLNGNFVNGDLICTTHIQGYGVKQNDDIIRNYTIAKITCDLDFDNIPKYIESGGEFIDGQYVRWALVGCVYLC
jgi:predicted acyltransferase (DUF342 family)